MFIITLFACSEYELHAKQTPPESHASVDTPVVETDTAADTAEEPVKDDTDIPVDTGEPPEPDECGFVVWNGNYNEDGSQTQVLVMAVPEYALYSPTVVSIAPGEDVTLEVGIGSRNACGEVKYNFFSFYAWDLTSTTTPWIAHAEADGAPSGFENVTTGELFQPSPTYENHPDDHNARYFWGDLTTIIGYEAVIATQVIPTNGETIYRFTFQVSEYVPSGTTLLIAFETGDWTDPYTGEVITDYNTDRSVWMEVNVE